MSNEIRSYRLPDKKRHYLPFIDLTIKSVAIIIKTVYTQADTASRKGLLQQTDTRIKALFLFFFIFVINLDRQIVSQLFITFFLLILIFLSRIPLSYVYRKVFMLSFFFGFLVIAPAALNIVTKGELIVTLLQFKSAHSFWIYHVPPVIGITKEGCLVVARFYVKVANSLTLTLLIIYTTSFYDLIKSLRIFRVHSMFLLVLTLTYKYIFILSQITEEIYFAMKSRWVKKTTDTRADKIIAGRISHIFRKSWIRYEEIYLAMEARGFTGRVKIIYTRKIKVHDLLFIVIFVSIGLICCFISFHQII